MPFIEQRHYVRHLHRSAGHTEFTLKQRLWAAAKATTILVYEAEIQLMNYQFDKAVKWQADKPLYLWSISHF